MFSFTTPTFVLYRYYKCNTCINYTFQAMDTQTTLITDYAFKINVKYELDEVH